MKKPSEFSKWHTETATKGKIYRAPFHDYRGKGIYMFTFTLRAGMPPLSQISGTVHNPIVTLTEFGLAAERILLDQPRFFPCEIYRYVIMPDHIHFLFEVTQPLKRHIGHEMGAIEGACKRALLSLFPNLKSATAGASIFRQKPHDRIIFDRQQLNTEKQYISDNPRRLLIKRLYPDLFHTYNHLSIGNKEMAAYGNIFLLKHFQKEQVRIHRAWSPRDFEAHRQKCLTCAANGGVLVSPFIHPIEKAIRDEALELGGNIITLRIDGFSDRFKPQGREFELCREGRLLLLAPWPDNINTDMNRSAALSLNDRAAEIATLPYTAQTRIKG